jgi:hypothetical protein
VITYEYMQLAGKCENPICAHDKRDGEEVSCVQIDPKPVHVADLVCKKCKHWKATPELQVKVTIEKGIQ